MSARKLGRVAGLVFVLAVVFGGVNTATANGQHASEGNVAAEQMVALTFDWD